MTDQSWLSKREHCEEEQGCATIYQDTLPI